MGEEKVYSLCFEGAALAVGKEHVCFLIDFLT
jgi:hypothetical protein